LVVLVVASVSAPGWIPIQGSKREGLSAVMRHIRLPCAGLGFGKCCCM
jgi:hypothetical protein